jgi:hypothetical protein
MLDPIFCLRGPARGIHRSGYANRIPNRLMAEGLVEVEGANR